MKSVTIIVLLVSSILLSGFIGVKTNYHLNELLQVSHQSNYSKEEEFHLFDEILEMSNNNEISQADMIRIVKSQKKQRTAAHKIMEGAQELSVNMSAILIALVLFQIALLMYYVKKKNE